MSHQCPSHKLASGLAGSTALTSEAGTGSLRWIFPHEMHCLHSSWTLLWLVLNAVVRLYLLQWPSYKEVAQPLDGWDTARPQWLSPSQFVSRLNSLAVTSNCVFGYLSNQRAFMEAWEPPTRCLIPMSHPKPTMKSQASYTVAMWKSELRCIMQFISCSCCGVERMLGRQTLGRTRNL
jgi:hypothetical protein